MAKENTNLRAMLDVGGTPKQEEQNNQTPMDSTGKYFQMAMLENFSTKEIDVRTHVTDTDIESFSDAETIADYFGGIPVIAFNVEKQKRLLISKNRGSRNEMREIAIGVPSSEDPEKKAERMRMDSLLGRR